MDIQKKQMREAAVLYYEKKYTQNEIAKMMGLTRQTVSKLLNDSIKENIVEIKIHNPDIDCKELEQVFCDKFNIRNAVICGVSSSDESLCRLMTVKKAADYIYSIIDYKPTLLFETTWSNPTDDVMYTDPSRQTAPASFRDTYLRNYGYNRVNHYNKMMELTKKYVLPNPAFDLVIDTATPIQYATEVLGVPLSSTDRVFDAYRDYTHISDFSRVIAAYAIYTQLFGIKELTEIKTPGVNAFDRPTYREISLGDLIFTDKHKKVILESVNYTLKHRFEL